MSRTTFLDLAARGEALVDDIDDHIDSWHDDQLGLSLHEYLGFSHEDYKLWLEQPAVLRFLVHQRRLGGDHAASLVDLLGRDRDGLLALAGRSEDALEAKTIVDWLVETGRLPARG